MLQRPDLLIGCGPTHLRWIAGHAVARRRGSMPWTWVVPHPRACFGPALLDWMAHGATAAPPLVDLHRLAEAAGARLIVDPIERLDHILASVAQSRVEHGREPREGVDYRQHPDLRPVAS